MQEMSLQELWFSSHIKRPNFQVAFSDWLFSLSYMNLSFLMPFKKINQ